MILKEYSKNPVRNIEMKDYTVKYHEWNFICGDDITIFLLLENNLIKDYSYIWETSTVSLAAAWFLSEFLIWENVDTVLSWGYNIMSEKWFWVSNKRKRAAVLALLAVRNAVHKYLNDDKIDDFDDLIEDV
jgi:NifU-like protein involved in Fe-S cluster formation